MLLTAFVALLYYEVYRRFAAERQYYWRSAKTAGSDVPRLSPRLRFWLWQPLILSAIVAVAWLNAITSS